MPVTTVRKAGSKVAILVAGMHRSGTSAMTRVLNLHGCGLPQTLLAANAANERGFWESPLINALNNEVLESAGSIWHSWERIDPEWFATPAATELKSKAVALLKDEFGDAQFIVLKDPRICRLFRFWREALQQLGAEVATVCVIRNPLEVAASLKSRNGFAAPFSYLLWLRHCLDAEFDTRGTPRSFVQYEDLLNDWRAVVGNISADLGLSWPTATEELAGEVNAFLSPGIRHHSEGRESAATNRSLSPWVRTTYQILGRWVNGGAVPQGDFKTLDEVRRHLDLAQPAFGELVAEGRLDKKRASELKSRLTKMTEEMAQTKDTASKNAVLAEVQNVKLIELQGQLAGKSEQLIRQETVAAAISAQLIETKAEWKGTLALLVEKADEAGKLRAEVAAEKARIAEAMIEAKNAQDSLIRQQDRAAAQLMEARDQLTQRTTELAEAREQVAQQATELATTNAQVEVQEREIQSLNREVQDASAQIKQIEVESATSAALLQQKVSELDELRQALANANVKIAAMDAAATRDDLRLVESKSRVEALSTERDAANKKLTEMRAAAYRARSDLDATNKKYETAGQELRRLQEKLHEIESTPVWRAFQLVDRSGVRIRRSLNLSRLFRTRPTMAAIELVRESELFDKDWYLSCNADVKEYGIDPAKHYTMHGWTEGRDPSPAFSSNWYLHAYPDVAEAGINPLVHYLRFGASEGRSFAPGVRRPTIVSSPPVPAPDPYSFPLQSAQEPSWVKHSELLPKNNCLNISLEGKWLGSIQDAMRGNGVDTIATALLAPIHAFCRMMGRPDEIHLSDGSAPRDLGSVDVVAGSPTESAVRCFAARGNIEPLSDVWFANSRTLRIRFSAQSGHAEPQVIRLFQSGGPGNDALRLVGESLIRGGPLDFVDACLGNPFFPVLITSSTHEGDLLSIMLLPFPSMCRGGAHYGELLASDDGSARSPDILAASEILLAEMLAKPQDALSPFIAGVSVPISGASGAERIFTPEMREWLACVMNVRLTPAEHPKELDRAASYLTAELKSADATTNTQTLERITLRHNTGAYQLKLPPDAVPSIQALVKYGQTSPSGLARTGSFLVADTISGTPKWLVQMPPLGPDLLDWQPVDEPFRFPMLEARQGAELIPLADTISFPVAIRFLELSSQSDAQLIMPIAPGVNQILPQRQNDAVADMTISVLVQPCLWDPAIFAGFVESLRLQTAAERVSLVVVTSASPTAEELATLNEAKALFPGRCASVRRQDDMPLSASINLAAADAPGRLLLIAGENIVLHDPRTLETLSVIADNERVASVGCLLVRPGDGKKGPAVVVRSTGIFASMPHSGELVFSETDCSRVMPSSTYPVAANTAKLFMVRTEVWNKLTGFNVTKFPEEFADIEFCLRAIDTGYIHLCTSIVSASVHGQTISDRYENAKPYESFPLNRWQDIASAVTVLGAFRA